MKRILNAGCGADTYGTDFVDAYPLRKEVKKCDLSEGKLPYPNNTFDEVYMKKCLEALYNPMNFLNESYRVLKTGGRLKLALSNAGYVGWLGRSGYGAWDDRSYKGEKVYMLYTIKTIQNMLHKAGFKVGRANYSFLEITSFGLKDLLVRLLGHLNERWMPYIEIEASKR